MASPSEQAAIQDIEILHSYVRLHIRGLPLVAASNISAMLLSISVDVFLTAAISWIDSLPRDNPSTEGTNALVLHPILTHHPSLGLTALQGTSKDRI